MDYQKEVVISGRTAKELAEEIAYFFLLNNCEVKRADATRVEVLNPLSRYSHKKLPTSEIMEAQFTLSESAEGVKISCQAKLFGVKRHLSQRRLLFYVLLAALVGFDALLSSGFLGAHSDLFSLLENSIILLYLPLLYLLLRYHFLKISVNNQYNDLGRLLHNLQFKNGGAL